MKRIISGVKPTGDLTLGNYLGTINSWVDQPSKGEAMFFIADLHSLNIRPNPDDLRRQTVEAAALLLASGVDPAKATIFVESHVPAISELMTILNNYVTIGELSRMTQFKDKSQKAGSEGQVAGLFEYPVLMAADILAMDAELVPVGDDQRQHVEITRDIAVRFNNLYGKTFTVPQPVIRDIAARVMNLQDPSRKMSKSDADTGGAIMLNDSMKVIEQKVMRAVTDSGSIIEASDDKPALTNLMQIYSAVTGMTIDQIQTAFAGKGYGDFKKDLAGRLVNELAPLQARHQELMLESDQIWNVLERGQAKANDIANARLHDVKQKIGLI